MAEPVAAEEVLEYWFGAAPEDPATAQEKAALWWGRSEATDGEEAAEHQRAFAIARDLAHGRRRVHVLVLVDLLDRRLHLFELVVGEMDMVLGDLADERDLEERIIALYAAARSEEEVARGFDVIAEELSAARGRYEQVRRLDADLFGRDYEA